MAPNREVIIRAVLFDYDDTLVDVSESRNYARQVIANRLSLMSKHNESYVLNLLMSIETEMESKGQFDRRVWLSEVANALGITLSSDCINNLVRAYWDAWRLRSRPFPDAVAALSRLRMCGLVLGIITNTDGEPGLKRDRISKDGLDKLFDLIIVAGDDTTHVKPHPEPFIKALRMLNMEGREVMYIGDRPSIDVPGAKAVGMRVGIIERSNSANPMINTPDGPGPDFVINSLTELPQLLECH